MFAESKMPRSSAMVLYAHRAVLCSSIIALVELADNISVEFSISLPLTESC